MKLAFAIFGLWTLGIGVWATTFSFRRGKIASDWRIHRYVFSRHTSPRMFWFGIGLYGLTTVIGAGFLIASIAHA